MEAQYIFTPREVFTHSLGSAYRTELDVADGVRGWWQIEDLNGNDICVISDGGSHWRRSTPFAGPFIGEYSTFSEALEAHLDAIQASRGVQTDELFWGGTGLPRWV